MKIKGVDFILYHVSDLKRSVDFYEHVLGLERIGEPGPSWAEFQVGNVTFDIGTFDGNSTSKCASAAFAVDDIKATVEELRKKGVTIIQEPYETPVCWGAGIADPDGNQIYLHKRKDGTFGD